MSSKTDMECYNSGWQDGYAEACYGILDMLASIPESGELIKIKEAIRKSVEHDDR
jgi:hypothetical protein